MSHASVFIFAEVVEVGGVDDAVEVEIDLVDLEIKHMVLLGC